MWISIPGQIGFSIRFRQESLFTSRRNPYSHHSGTIIHMPRNSHETVISVGVPGSGAAHAGDLGWLIGTRFLSLYDSIPNDGTMETSLCAESRAVVQ